MTSLLAEGRQHRNLSKGDWTGRGWHLDDVITLGRRPSSEVAHDPVSGRETGTAGVNFTDTNALGSSGAWIQGQSTMQNHRCPPGEGAIPGQHDLAAAAVAASSILGQGCKGGLACRRRRRASSTLEGPAASRAPRAREEPARAGPGRGPPWPPCILFGRVHGRGAGAGAARAGGRGAAVRLAPCAASRSRSGSTTRRQPCTGGSWSAPTPATISRRSATSATSSRWSVCASSTPARSAEPARTTREELRRRGEEPFCRAVPGRGGRALRDGRARGCRSHGGPGGRARAGAGRCGRPTGHGSSRAGSPPTVPIEARIVQALDALGRSQNAELQPDRLELGGRLDLLEDRPARALPAFRTSADLRRDAKDYLGMARGLALAGRGAAEEAGLSDRCGRSLLLPRRAQRRGGRPAGRRQALAQRRRAPRRDHRPDRNPRPGERPPEQPRRRRRALAECLPSARGRCRPTGFGWPAEACAGSVNRSHGRADTDLRSGPWCDARVVRGPPGWLR